jgi:predicted extracellular nuclease
MARAAGLGLAAAVLGAAACGWPFVEPTPTPSGVRVAVLQGAGHRSPLEGQTVAGVPGVVTALRPNGFYLQDPAADDDERTSEAVFVFTGARPDGVAVGDDLRVDASVAEFRPGGAAGEANLTTTQLVTPTWRTLARGAPTPTPVPVGPRGRSPPTSVVDDDSAGDAEQSARFDPAADGLDFYEALEGMLVRIEDAVAVGPRSAFGEIVVLAGPGGGPGDGAGPRTPRGGILLRPDDPNPERIVLDDELLVAAGRQMPSADVGDRLPGALVGVVDYSFGNFKLQLLQPPRVEPVGLARTRLPPARPEQLAVATFNVENLHPAAEAGRVETLARLIVEHLASPDLVALEEVGDATGPRDDGVVDARSTYDRLLGAIRAAGGPAYQVRQIDPENNRDGGEPGTNIRVGLLFRTDRGLRFVDRGRADARTATRVVVGPGGPTLSVSPGRVEPDHPAWENSRKPLAGELEFRGRRLFAIANHFVSKGGDRPLFGRFQPPPRPSEARRLQQAALVGDFVARLLEADPDAAVVVLGDLNDFPFSATLAALKGVGLRALIETLPENERYSYVFEGNSQALDHILVSPALARAPLDFALVHANAEFAEQASDHDPPVARLSLP